MSELCRVRRTPAPLDQSAHNVAIIQSIISNDISRFSQISRKPDAWRGKTMIIGAEEKSILSPIRHHGVSVKRLEGLP
jgi:hypothetical protein